MISYTWFTSGFRALPFTVLTRDVLVTDQGVAGVTFVLGTVSVVHRVESYEAFTNLPRSRNARRCRFMMENKYLQL